MNITTLSDEQLVVELILGNQKAMSEIYTRYYPLVLKKALSFTKGSSNASDIAQDIMIKVLGKIHLFDGKSKFRTWLYSITNNYCIDDSRKSKRMHFKSINSSYKLSKLSTSELDEVDQGIIEDAANQALAEISKEDQHLLFLKYELHKSIHELQETYHLSGSAVKMRLFRAKLRANQIYNRLTLEPAA
jgi:RNA polymerase sigma-70 factor (ECF subfamily)